MTHRDRARNAASSRAVSVKKGLTNCTFRPIDIPSEQKGMQGGNAIGQLEKDIVYRDMDEMCEFVLSKLNKWVEFGVHKSIINRYLEPFAYIEVVCTATRWDHFLGLRDAPDAEPHFQILAKLIRKRLDESIPQRTDYHVPFIKTGEIETLQDRLNSMQISAARCAGISYKRPDFTIEKELKVCEDLVTKRHSSPLEHPATAFNVPLTCRSGPMVGWMTLRSLMKQD